MKLANTSIPGTADLYTPNRIGKYQPRTRTERIADELREEADRARLAQWASQYVRDHPAPKPEPVDHAANMREALTDAHTLDHESIARKLDGVVGLSIGLRTVNKQTPEGKGKQTRLRSGEGVFAFTRPKGYNGTVLERIGFRRMASGLKRIGVYGHPFAPIVNTIDQPFTNAKGTVCVLKGRAYGDSYAKWRKTKDGSYFGGDIAETVYNYRRALLQACYAAIGMGVDMGRIDRKAGQRGEGTAIRTKYDPNRGFSVEDITHNLLVYGMTQYANLPPKARGSGFWKFVLENNIRQGHGWTGKANTAKGKANRLKGKDRFIARLLDAGYADIAIMDKGEHYGHTITGNDIARIALLLNNAERNGVSVTGIDDTPHIFDIETSQTADSHIMAVDMLEAMDIFSSDYLMGEDYHVWHLMRQGLSDADIVRALWDKGIEFSAGTVLDIRRRVRMAVDGEKDIARLARIGLDNREDMDYAWRLYKGPTDANRRRNTLPIRDMDSAGNKKSERAVKGISAAKLATAVTEEVFAGF